MKKIEASIIIQSNLPLRKMSVAISLSFLHQLLHWSQGIQIIQMCIHFKLFQYSFLKFKVSPVYDVHSFNPIHQNKLTDLHFKWTNNVCCIVIIFSTFSHVLIFFFSYYYNNNNNNDNASTRFIWQRWIHHSVDISFKITENVSSIHVWTKWIVEDSRLSEIGKWNWIVSAHQSFHSSSSTHFQSFVQFSHLSLTGADIIPHYCTRYHSTVFAIFEKQSLRIHANWSVEFLSVAFSTTLRRNVQQSYWAWNFLQSFRTRF